jgi:hypothetical protein
VPGRITAGADWVLFLSALAACRGAAGLSVRKDLPGYRNRDVFVAGRAVHPELKRIHSDYWTDFARHGGQFASKRRLMSS